MRKPFTIRRILTGILVWGLVGFTWFSFAPPALGGKTDYVVTDGISMEPNFHGGDLVLVRAQKSYHVGEIVAYRSKALNTVVLHRIIGLDGSRYIFKGDNNNFVDIEHPARSQLVGALWLHIPGRYVGVLSSLREPPVIGGLVALGALLLGGGAFTARSRRRKRRRTFADGQVQPQEARFPSAAAIAGDVVLTGVAVLIASAAVAAVAYSKPLVGPAPTSIPYTQSGAFSYSSTTASGPAYPGGRVTTGDPVFMKLVDDLNVRFAYRFSARPAHHIAGTASFDARIVSSSGWSKTLVLEPPTPFRGDRTVVAGTLTLAPLLQILHGLEQTTQVPGSYTLSLVPHVFFKGAIGGVSAHSTFSQPLAFSLNPLELQPVLSSATTSSTAPQTTTPNLLDPSAAGSVTGLVDQPRALAFGPASVAVKTARQVAVDGITAGICLLLAGLTLLIRASARRGDVAADILGRYGRSLIRVARAPRPSASDLVELDNMETLVRIAERYDRMILHERMMGADTFSVPEDGVLYRYAIPSEVLFRHPMDTTPLVMEPAEAPTYAHGPVADVAAPPGEVRWGPWSAPAVQDQPAA
jgi:signal peptidase I